MRTYIVEDHEEMRIILKRTLRKNFPAIQIVGESETAERAIDEIPDICPQLVMVDISLPGMDGIELIRRLRPRCRSIYILVVTGHDVDQYRNEALGAGADEIVSKEDRKQIIKLVKECWDRMGGSIN